MDGSQLTILNAIPDPAMLLRDGRLLAANPAARSLLPAGEESGELARLCPGPGCAGTLSLGGRSWQFTASPAGEDTLLLLRPAPEEGSPITSRQLDGTLRRLREQLGTVLLTAQLLERGERSGGQYVAVLNHSFCQILRLVDRLDLLRAGEDSLSFSPVTMDLAGLCRQLADAAAPLLERAGIFLDCRLSPPSLLISGDPELLRRLILELLSNAAGAAGEGGELTLSLTLRGRRAVLTCSDTGHAPDAAALFSGGDLEELPRPGEGAGLGLALARRIVALHGGSLVAAPLQPRGLSVAVALPAQPEAGASLPLRTPRAEYGGGLSPLLVELSEVLPAELYLPESLR